MSVLLVRPRSSGGLAAHVDQELVLLRERGVDVREADVSIQESPRPVDDLRTIRALRGQVRMLRPAAVHAHGLRAGALSALSLGHGRRTGPRVRLVVTLHNRTMGSAVVRAVGAVLLKVLVVRADTVLAVSPDLADAARRAGARDVRHAIIPAPVDRPGASRSGAEGARASDDGASEAEDGPARAAPPDDASLDAESGGPLEVLVLARLAPQKGLGDLLDAAALLSGRDVPVRILIAGDGPQRQQLEARIRSESLPVELLGWRTDTAELLSSADLVVSSARWEGQPVALQEALRAGRAVVATDAGGTRWVTGGAAELVPVGDAEALAAAIAEHRDPRRRRAAARASLERAAELPDAGDLADQLLDLLDARAARW